MSGIQGGALVTSSDKSQALLLHWFRHYGRINNYIPNSENCISKYFRKKQCKGVTASGNQLIRNMDVSSFSPSSSSSSFSFLFLLSISFPSPIFLFLFPFSLLFLSAPPLHLRLSSSLSLSLSISVSLCQSPCDVGAMLLLCCVLVSACGVVVVWCLWCGVWRCCCCCCSVLCVWWRHAEKKPWKKPVCSSQHLGVSFRMTPCVPATRPHAS